MRGSGFIVSHLQAALCIFLLLVVCVCVRVRMHVTLCIFIAYCLRGRLQITFGKQNVILTFAFGGVKLRDVVKFNSSFSSAITR